MKFFIFQEQVPLHDEVTAIERFTEIHNFLRKDGVNNHTLISIYGTFIRYIFGFDLILFRLISFISFIGIVFLFNKIFNNCLFTFFFLVLIFNSNFLFNAMNTFRGYYIYSFLSCLTFYLILILNKDNQNIKVLRYIFVILFLLTINALYGLYIVLPVLLSILLKNFKNKSFYLNGLIFFLIPVFLTYILFFFIDGFVINNNNNLNFDFLLNNFNLIFLENIKTGFENIISGTPALNKDNDFKSLLYASQRFLNGEDAIYSREYIFLLVYVSCILLLVINFLKGYNIIDYSIIFIFVVFFLIDKDPFIRIHSGIIFFCIFYLFYDLDTKIKSDHILQFYSKSKVYFSAFIIILTLVSKPDLKWQETKTSVENIKKTLSVSSCLEANDILSNYEVWIIKSIYPNKCQIKYDFEKRINLLY